MRVAEIHSQSMYIMRLFFHTQSLISFLLVLFCITWVLKSCRICFENDEDVYDQGLIQKQRKLLNFTCLRTNSLRQQQLYKKVNSSRPLCWSHTDQLCSQCGVTRVFYLNLEYSIQDFVDRQR
jgi:hypothetical protein